MIKRRNITKAEVALLLFGFCILAFLSSDVLLGRPSSDVIGRRQLRARARRKRPIRGRGSNNRKLTAEPDAGVFPWAESNLKSVGDPPDPANDVALFWHVPKSGGTAAKSLYECLDLSLAKGAGALKQFGHASDEEIVVFRPFGIGGPKYANVDTTTAEGILRSERLGLVPSGLADIIFTSYPGFAVGHLYSEKHRGRAFGLFRHPVERLVSKFYYLQVA